MKHSFLPGPNFGPKAVELQHIVSENNLRNFVVFYKTEFLHSKFNWIIQLKILICH